MLGCEEISWYVIVIMTYRKVDNLDIKVKETKLSRLG